MGVAEKSPQVQPMPLGGEVHVYSQTWGVSLRLSGGAGLLCEALRLPRTFTSDVPLSNSNAILERCHVGGRRPVLWRACTTCQGRPGSI